MRLALEEARVDYVDVASVQRQRRESTRARSLSTSPLGSRTLLGEQGLRSSAELSDARVIRIVNARV